MGTTVSGTAPHMMAGPMLLCVYKDEALSGGYHGSGPPQTDPEPPRDGSGPPTCGSRTSSRPEPSSQPRGPDPAPYSGRGSELPRAPVGAATDPRVWCRHMSHRREPPNPAPYSGRGPEPPRAPVGASANPRVRCRHVSHMHEFSAVSQPACCIKCGWLRRALPTHLPH